MRPSLHLTLLGDFCLALDDEPVFGLDAPRLQALLACLVLNRHAPQPRRRMAFLFWPDSTEAQALTNLRRELHHLRRTLPEADRHLRVTHGSIQWAPDAPCRIDVVELEAAIAAAAEARAASREGDRRRALERAVAEYGGDLLPNCYDRWIDEDRDRLRGVFEGALVELIEACERERDYVAAIRAAERLASHDPLREAFHARLIGLCAAAGDRASALRAYQRAAETLERELGVEPGPALREARAGALNDAPPATAATRPVSDRTGSEAPAPVAGPGAAVETSPLVGRGDEVSTIRTWMREATGRAEPHDSVVLLLAGEPGIGKTRLLDELATLIRDTGGRFIRGRGFEAEMVRPYGAWIDALRSVPREWVEGSPQLSLLVPELRGSGSAPSDRDRLFDAVASWLVGLADEGGPVGVLIDDIQWLDEASAALLHYLTRVRNQPSPILVACAARPAEVDRNGPVSGLLRALTRSRQVRTIELGPMSRDQVSALARSVDSSVDADRVYDQSGGNPLLALEIARARVARADGESRSIEDLVHDRIARLGEPERDLLSWAAALGRGFNPSTAALVAGRPLSDLLPTLERLEFHGILRPGDAPGNGSYDFGHDIVRAVAYAAISAPRRRLMHLRIARALDAQDDPEGDLAGDIAHHAALGGDPAMAAAAAATAGLRYLRLFAYSEADEIARRGVELTRGLPETERIGLHLRLLRVRIACGAARNRAALVEDELRALIADARAVGSLDLEAVGHSLLSVLSYNRDDLSRVHQSSIQAAETLDAGSSQHPEDLHTTARTLSQTGTCLASICREMERAEALLLEAESLADRLRIQLIDIPMGLGIVRVFQGAHDEAVLLLERGLRMARREQDHFRACECLVALVTSRLETGDARSALDYARQLLPVAAKLTEGSEAPFSRALEALSRYVLSTPGAAQDVERCLAELCDLDAPRKLALVQLHAGEADYAAERFDTARERAGEALEAARVVGHGSGMARAGALLVRCARATGDNRRVQAEVVSFRSLLDELGSYGDLSAHTRQMVAAAGVESDVRAGAT
jgi:DNA-binding SARP family transcriptional activator